MHRHLYFICPSDHIESLINQTFRHDNYFLSSLGNSMVIDANLVEEIMAWMDIKSIREITFVLSSDNQIIHDAIKQYDFCNVKRLHNYYNEIFQVKMRLKGLWHMDKEEMPVLSYFLKTKVHALQTILSGLNQIDINGKIYCSSTGTFNELDSRIFMRGCLSLN